MSTHMLSAQEQTHLPAWPRRLGLILLLLVGACIAYLPYAFYPLIPATVRPFLWGAITLGFLALALLARRSERLHAYWVVLYAFFVASSANLADWYLNDWLPGLFGIPTRSPAGNGIALLESTLVIGACIETDAHTVGIDAIMNMKGYNGHKGLESYHQIRAINMGAQVDSEELVTRAIEERADVILVSQVVTQKNIHLDNLTKLSDLLEAEGLRERVILVVGGPRIGHELAKELGYDAGFGPKSYAEDVASFAIHEWITRRKH